MEEQEREKRKGMALHSCTENKEMNHTGRPVEEWRARVSDEGVVLPCLLFFLSFFLSFRAVFRIISTSSLRERRRQGQVN